MTNYKEIIICHTHRKITVLLLGRGWVGAAEVLIQYCQNSIKQSYFRHNSNIKRVYIEF
jgi:hypothetical protein